METCGGLLRVCSPLDNGQGVLHAAVVCGGLGTTASGCNVG